MQITKYWKFIFNVTLIPVSLWPSENCVENPGNLGVGVGVRSPDEQFWTGLQWSTPDVTSGGGVFGPLVWVTYPMMHLMLPTPPPWTDGRLWKHYLPEISFVGGNNIFLFPVLKCKWICIILLPVPFQPRSRHHAVHPILGRVPVPVSLSVNEP